MNVGIVVWNLFGRGGLERFGINLANAMQKKGHQVTIFYEDKKNRPQASSYPLRQEINLVGLVSNRYHPDTIPEIRHRIVASEVDVVVALFSWEDLILFPIALEGTGIPLLVSERNAPDIVEARWNHAEERHACLSVADNIHILSRNYLSGFRPYLHRDIHVIPNPALQKVKEYREKERKERKTLLGVGRFSDRHKQFSLLIKSFASLSEEFPDWDLVICGNGEDKKMYNKLVASLKITERVFLPGMVDDPAPYYASSDLFCISSRFEGFPNVIPEAQDHGLPVVGFAQCPGTNEIIVHGENGLLAPEMTASSLVDTLKVLMENEELRVRMGKRGKELLDRYNETKIYDCWEKLISETAACKGNTRLQTMSPRSAEEEKDIVKFKEILNRSPLFKKRSRWSRLKRSLVKRLPFGSAVETKTLLSISPSPADPTPAFFDRWSKG